jgi:chromosome segregation ATPase
MRVSKAVEILAPAIVSVPVGLFIYMQTALPFSPDQIVLGLVAIGSTALNWRFAAFISSLKLEMANNSSTLRAEISTQLNMLRQEFSSGFVPAPLATEQRSSLLHRLEKVETEVERNRGRIHDISGTIMKDIVGEIFQIKTQLTDKARRMAAMEAHRETEEGMLHEHANKCRELSDRHNDLERRLQYLERSDK